MGFEQREGFQNGSEIELYPSWRASTPGSGKVVDIVSAEGTQCIEVSPSSTEKAVQRKFDIAKNVVFIDFELLPVADLSKEPLYCIDANGSRLGFVADGQLGEVVSVSNLSPQGSEAVSTGVNFAFDEQGRSCRWIRITVRQDLSSRKWDLFVDGKLVLVNQILAGAITDVGIVQFYSADSQYYVDDFVVSDVNPLFLDSDRDGIPDAEEIVQGTNAFWSDRDLDLNGDGASNVTNFLHGSPIGYGVKGRKKIVYVDNQRGNDEFSGAISYRGSGDGPKASVGAALQSSHEGDSIIALMPSDKTYSFVNPKGLDITITMIPVGDIRIETE